MVRPVQAGLLMPRRVYFGGHPLAFDSRARRWRRRLVEPGLEDGERCRASCAQTISPTATWVALPIGLGAQPKLAQRFSCAEHASCMRMVLNANHGGAFPKIAPGGMSCCSHRIAQAT